MSSSLCVIDQLPTSSNNYLTVFWLQEWCSTNNNPCAAGSTLSFTLSSSFQNQDYVVVTTPASLQLSIYTSDKLYKYDEVVSSVSLSPSLVLAAVDYLDYQYLADLNNIYGLYVANANYLQIKFKVNTYIISNDG